ncbi:Splicing factor 3B subunit 3 [Thelohanellus kitauei]|uniref:Splicing factor 3B subunit 3 n=1 Tax=Thelohanellus kitauei TaxID=669202 RepID=A0A0C2N0H6_THEKT|nr:Splicing factor 3B subunit 3 [Thelohanellus kitauei]
MNLYHLTLQNPTAIYSAVHGNFSGGRIQEIAVSKGTMLELLKHDPNTGRITVLTSVEAFGIIRSLMAFRLTGGQKDYLVVGSDSGRIVILEYDPVKNQFEKLHQETFGKTGCRRIVPGQYLAMDPKGRAVMVAAIEKQKFVYIFNRDTQARLTISSPLEAHKSFNVTFSVVGMDVGFENPLFACLEMDYEEADIYNTEGNYPPASQNLTYYELDLGLNHVVRKSTTQMEHFGNLLLQVPGGKDGPGGLLVCCENYIVYHNIGSGQDIKCLIPRRRDDLDMPDRTILIVCATTYKSKNLYFFLAQTEQGDLFKITLETQNDLVTEIRVKYFDTIPVASALCVLKTGFLFSSSEFGNHHFYQIIKLGEEKITPEFSSFADATLHKKFFYDRHVLTNLLLVDTLESYSPIIDCHVADLMNDDTPQFYILKGRARESAFCILRHGLEVTEVAVSELPGSAVAVWSVKRTTTDEYDSYIIVSFVNATLVLSIGETVEEVTDSGLLTNVSTLHCGLLDDDSLVQIFNGGIRHIRPDKRFSEWCVPSEKQVIKCTMNRRQIVISLTGNEIVYFELDPNGQLNEYSERREMPSAVLSMALGPIPPTHVRSRFLAITLADQTVRMVSLDPQDCLQPLSMQALPATAESLCIVEACFGDEDSPFDNSLHLNIGLRNGVLLRTSLDPVTGDLSDTRTRYLGSKPIKLFRLIISKTPAVLAVSSRNWLCYYYQNRYNMTPLTYEILDFAASLSSEHCPEGIVAVCNNSLRILIAEKLGQVFNKTSYMLRYTPRKFLLESSTKTFFILECEYNALNSWSTHERKQHISNEIKEALIMDETPEKVDEYVQNFLANDTQTPKAGVGTWASLLRAFDPIRLETLDIYEFPQNEGLHCMTLGRFVNRITDFFLIVGVSTGLILNPRVSTGGIFYTFFIQFYPDGSLKFHVMHKTYVDEVPGAVLSFQGKVVAGVGHLLCVYDLGKQKLLKKCENKRIPSLITNIISIGHRLIVFDAQESFHFVKYKPFENQLVIFADDVTPRWLTTGCLLDYSTMAGADKFGNIFGIRLDSDVKDDIDEDPTGIRSLWDRGLLNGAPQKAELMFNVHIGATANSLQKCSLVPGGTEILFYTTLSGSIGVLAPITTKEDLDFLHHIELYLRQELPSPVGRDHLAYRSYYFPLKSVIDGDTCEQFNYLERSKRIRIADELDRTPQELSKKLEDMRTKYAL